LAREEPTGATLMETTPKPAEILERLETLCDGIQGKNELRVGVMMCNSVMIEAAAVIRSLLPAARAGDDVVELKKQNEMLRDALEQADLAINPPDRDGISLHVWSERLKEITALIHKVLSQ
jgi:hypothetical protein